MIEISQSTAYILYLALTVGVLVSIWLWSHYAGQKKAYIQPKNVLCVCEYCHHGYITPSSNKVSRCPQCESYNKRE